MSYANHRQPATVHPNGLFDSHAHLDDKAFDVDREQVIEQCIAAGMAGIINAGADMQSSARSIELANRYDLLWAAVGIHPHDARHAFDADYAQLEYWARNERKVVAIGEIGLDYHYDFSPREVQRAVFAQQLKLAKALDKPVIIHNREAHGDMLDVLRGAKNGLRGVLHCYSGSAEMLRELLDMGLYISVGGPVTFANAKKLLEIVPLIPPDKLLIETDCPYLTPVPYRGKRNIPLYTALVAEKIAHILALDVGKIVEQSAANTRRLFDII